MLAARAPGFRIPLRFSLPFRALNRVPDPSLAFRPDLFLAITASQR